MTTCSASCSLPALLYGDAAKTVGRTWSTRSTPIPNLEHWLGACVDQNGKLRIENSRPRRLTQRYWEPTAQSSARPAGSDDRRQHGPYEPREQFNEFRDQLDKLADDASYNGVNLLRGDLLKLTSNETGTFDDRDPGQGRRCDERLINYGHARASTPRYQRRLRHR